MQAAAGERVAASSRRGAGAQAEWHEACTALRVNHSAESSRLVWRILKQSRTGGQLLTVDSLPAPDLDDQPRWSRMELEQLYRGEEPCAARTAFQLASPSRQVTGGAGRKEVSLPHMFSIDSRLGVSRIVTYAGWMLSGPSFASTGRPGYGGGFVRKLNRARGAQIGWV